MAFSIPVPFGPVLRLPAEALNALRLVPVLVQHTEAMTEHTAVLIEMSEAIRGVAGDTAVLPAIESNMASVAAATSVLEPMDGRMATIESAMPVLVEVQGHLAQVPERIEALEHR